MSLIGSKFTKLAVLSLSAAILAACGESEEPKNSNGAATQTEAAKPAAKEEKKDPYLAVLPAVDEADRGQYVSLDDDPLNILRFYLKNRAWEESKEEVVKKVLLPGAMLSSDGKPKVYERYEGLDQNLQIADAQYRDTEEAFAKRDFMEKYYSMLIAEAEKVGSNRLVKFEIELDYFGVKTYNFDTKSFDIKSCMLSEKLTYARNEGPGSGCLKAYRYNTITKPFQYGLTEAQWLSKIVIEDENVARAIEKARLNKGKFVFYGYISQAKHASYLGDYGDRFYNDERQIEIVPHFVDIVDGDQVIFTARKG